MKRLRQGKDVKKDFSPVFGRNHKVSKRDNLHVAKKETTLAQAIKDTDEER